MQHIPLKDRGSDGGHTSPNCVQYSHSLTVVYSRETAHQEQSKSLREGITKRRENKDNVKQQQSFSSLSSSFSALTGT